jgi:hypothetical protein
VLFAIAESTDVRPRSTISVVDRSGRELATDTIEGQIEHPLAVDLDRDGKIDIVASMWTGIEPGYVMIWRGRSCAQSAHAAGGS